MCARPKERFRASFLNYATEMLKKRALNLYTENIFALRNMVTSHGFIWKSKNTILHVGQKKE